jgi:hypothetical protein
VDATDDTSNSPDGAKDETHQTFTHHNEAVFEHRETYGPPGFKGLFSNSYIVARAAFSTLGGLLFGYDQSVVSVTLVMPQSLDRIPCISEMASGAGF